jgi:ParB family chromosome partitioning protein
MPTAKKRLGRGLGGLIQGTAARKPEPEPTKLKGKAPVRKTSKAASKPEGRAPVATDADSVGLTGFRELAVRQIVPNPRQPRRHFEEGAVEELAESIRSEGLLQPVVVRKKTDQEFELIAGERRLRAFRHLGLKEIPARVIDASDASSAVLSLVENLQRENLNPIEEARGYASLLRDFGLTQEAVAERLGKGRSAVTNALRLLTLDEESQAFLARGLLTVGHAKVLLGAEDARQRMSVARQCIEAGPTVRQLEDLVRSRRKEPSVSSISDAKSSRGSLESEVIDRLQRDLSSKLATRVQLKHQGKKGRLIIDYHGNEDLERLLQRLQLADD